MAKDDSGAVPFWFRIERGASEDASFAVEQALGISLPAELKALLSQQDGGVSNFTGFEKDGAYYPVLPFLSVDPKHSGDTLITAQRVRDSFGVPAGVYVFAADGHAWMGLDYRAKSGAPSIVYSGDAGETVELVADDFEEFLAHLVE